MKKFTFAIPCALLLLLAGCGSQSTQQSAAKKAAEKPAEPVGGRYALYQMYMAARGTMGADIEVLTERSIALQGVTPERGKAPAWEAVFVSPSTQRARTYTYSVIEAEGNLHKGVFAGPEQGWSGPRYNQKPFPMVGAKIETIDAFQTALKKGEEYDKKNPGKPITFLLERGAKYPDPTWRVIWGESVGTSNFSVLVDAATGNYLETLR